MSSVPLHFLCFLKSRQLAGMSLGDAFFKHHLFFRIVILVVVDAAPEEEKGVDWCEKDGEDEGIAHGVGDFMIAKPVVDRVHEEGHVVKPLGVLIHLLLFRHTVAEPNISGLLLCINLCAQQTENNQEYQKFVSFHYNL